jgi:hypothetical protein
MKAVTTTANHPSNRNGRTMTEIVERLERQAVNVENDGHVSAARAMREAATALTEARAEIERLQRALFFWMPCVDERLDPATRELAADDAGLLAGYSDTSDKPCWGDGMIDRAIAAESELSTLRARVREVVGPFAEVAGSEAFQSQTREWRDLVIAKPSGTRLAFIQTDSFRAARQLMEEVK